MLGDAIARLGDTDEVSWSVTGRGIN